MDSEYKGMSDTLSINSAQKVNKMALLFERLKFKIVASSRLRTYTLKIFSQGSTMVGPW